MLRTALVGFGPAGAGLHAPLIARTPGLRLSAVVTGNPERRERVLSDHPGAEVLSAPDRLWEEPGLCDLVVVATPNRTHADLAERALRAGLPVIVDKPLATSAEEADRLVAVSHETGVPLAVFHNRRFDSDFLAVRQLADSGELGDIVRYEARWERWRPEIQEERWRESGREGDGGGLLWDLGSHMIDQALVLFGRPSTVYAELANRRPGARTDDDSFVDLRYDGGPTVQIWMSLVAIQPGPRFRVTGLSGLFESHGLDPQELRLRGDRAPEVLARVVTSENGDPQGREVTPPAGDYGDFYALVRDALRAGGPMPVTGEDGAGVVRVIEAARASARDRQVVAL